MYVYPAPRVSKRRRKRRTHRALLSFGRTRVVTLVDDQLRDVINAGGGDDFEVVHTASLDQAMTAVSSVGLPLVLFSPRLVERDLTILKTACARHPGMTMIAVLDEKSPRNDLLLKLGAIGVSEVANLRDRHSWERLRHIATHIGGEVGSIVAGQVLGMVVDASPEARRFFAITAQLAPRTTTVRSLAEQIGILPSSLMSRFFRASLPAPRSYLSMMRLLYAAWGFGQPRASIAAVTDWLAYSSPQAFGRHVRQVLGVTAGGFRRELPLHEALRLFRERLVAPYLDTLRAFRPFGGDDSYLPHRQHVPAKVADA